MISFFQFLTNSRVRLGVRACLCVAEYFVGLFGFGSFCLLGGEEGGGRYVWGCFSAVVFC